MRALVGAALLIVPEALEFSGLDQILLGGAGTLLLIRSIFGGDTLG